MSDDGSKPQFSDSWQSATNPDYYLVETSSSKKTYEASGTSMAFNISAMLYPNIGLMKDSLQHKAGLMKVYLPGLSWTFNQRAFDTFGVTGTSLSVGYSSQDDTKNSVGAKGIAVTYAPRASLDTVSSAVAKGLKSGTAAVHVNGAPVKATI